MKKRLSIEIALFELPDAWYAENKYGTIAFGASPEEAFRNLMMQWDQAYDESIWGCSN